MYTKSNENMEGKQYLDLVFFRYVLSWWRQTPNKDKTLCNEKNSYIIIQNNFFKLFLLYKNVLLFIKKKARVKTYFRGFCYS